MTSVFIAVSGRARLLQESLNMSGSVGNVTKHRRAPIVVRTSDGYRVVYVPVVSGMTLAHHYQRYLARIARTRGLPVTKMSELGYFMKFSDINIIRKFYKEVYDDLVNVEKRVEKRSLPCIYERILVSKCTVADVTGFLFTDGGVRRVSRISFSYMVPALDAVDKGGVGLVPQIHVRFTPTAEEREQIPLNVENGSALYTFTVLLELDGIGRLDMCEALGEAESRLRDSGKDGSMKRAEAAVAALASMLGNFKLGAKTTRSFPHYILESAVVVSGRGPVPFIPSPGHYPTYIVDTVERLDRERKILPELEATIYYTKRENIAEPGENAHRVGTIEEAIWEAFGSIKKALAELYKRS